MLRAASYGFFPVQLHELDEYESGVALLGLRLGEERLAALIASKVGELFGGSEDRSIADVDAIYAKAAALNEAARAREAAARNAERRLLEAETHDLLSPRRERRLISDVLASEPLEESEGAGGTAPRGPPDDDADGDR